MAEKQSILGRIAQLTRANINSLLDRAEDPEKMIDQLIRDYTNSIAEAEQAIAQTIGNLRFAEQDFNADVAAVKEWGDKARAAAGRADDSRAKGDQAAADRYDNLARLALQKQIGFEREVESAKPLLESQNEVVEKLKSGLGVMKEKLTDLKTRRDNLVARQRTANAQSQVQSAVSSINVLDPTSELSRFEEQVRRQEAEVTGRNELAASSLESQFKELEESGDQLELEARFEALRSGGNQQQLDGGAPPPQQIDSGQPQSQPGQQPAQDQAAAAPQQFAPPAGAPQDEQAPAQGGYSPQPSDDERQH